MEMSNSLDAVLSRRMAEHADRAAEVRTARLRENSARAPVAKGEAVSHNEEDQTASPIEPAAVFDRTRKKDVGHLIDLIA